MIATLLALAIVTQNASTGKDLISLVGYSDTVRSPLSRSLFEEMFWPLQPDEEPSLVCIDDCLFANLVELSSAPGGSIDYKIELESFSQGRYWPEPSLVGQCADVGSCATEIRDRLLVTHLGELPQ